MPIAGGLAQRIHRLEQAFNRELGANLNALALDLSAGPLSSGIVRLADMRQLARSVMATPPTIGPIVTSSAISSGIKWPAVASGFATPRGGHFKYHCGADPVQAGPGFPDYDYIKMTNFSTTNVITSFYVVSFYFSGTTLEFICKGNTTGQFMIKVDDQYVSLTPIANTGAGTQNFLPITFASRAWRRIDIAVQGAYFGGIQTGPLDTLIPTETRGPRCIIMGDSFSEGTGGVAGQALGWTRAFQEALGWDDVFPSAEGATGYLNPGTAGRVKYGDRLNHDVIGYAPDIVVMQGGINDWQYNPGSGIVTPAQIQAEAASDFARIKAAVPNCLIVVLSPFWRNGPSTMPAGLMTCRDALKAAAAATGCVFVDVLEMPIPYYTAPLTSTLAAGSSGGAGTVSSNAYFPPRAVIKIESDRAEVKSTGGGPPYTLTLDGTLTSAHAINTPITQIGSSLWTGTGRVGAPSGYGNCDLIVSGDGTHPSQEGHDVVGQTVARLLLDATAT